MTSREDRQELELYHVNFLLSINLDVGLFSFDKVSLTRNSTPFLFDQTTIYPNMHDLKVLPRYVDYPQTTNHVYVALVCIKNCLCFLV